MPEPTKEELLARIAELEAQVESRKPSISSPNTIMLRGAYPARLSSSGRFPIPSVWRSNSSARSKQRNVPYPLFVVPGYQFLSLIPSCMLPVALGEWRDHFLTL